MRAETTVPLTAAQLATLAAVARGGSYKAAARELVVSEHTIKNHVTDTLRRLGAPSVTTACVMAVERGWLRDVTTGGRDGR